MKKHNDHKISEILDQFVESKKLRSGYYRVGIEEAWNEIMGKTIQGYTQSIHFHKGMLTLKVNSAPLRHELSMGKEKIIDLLNQKLGKRIVQDIYIK